jgi:glutamate synthase domain-containing protein 1
MRRYDEKEISGCGIIGIMSEAGQRFSGEAVINSISIMRERANGLGGGFAAYGIYPDFAGSYAFHLMYEREAAKRITEDFLKENFVIEKEEPIPTRKVEPINHQPLLWRYFLNIKKENLSPDGQKDEEDFVVKSVMSINSEIEDAFVASSGKNMGIFKGVGFPEDIGRFYRLEEYEGYIWTAHGRFPTNSAGWWGGAHPFGLLDWSVVHNGEISSYGINRRYLLNFGYRCTLFTDTEVMTYLFDLLVRKHRLDFQIVAKILASPFWEDIERQSHNERKMFTALRMIYGSALVNGPFGIVVGHSKGMMGLNDRIKLRPLVAARKNDMLYIASEEAAIREVCSSPDKVWAPKAGEPVIGTLRN